MDSHAPVIYIVEPYGGSIRRHNPSLPMVFWDDAAVTRGDGIFETLLIRDGRPANVERHMERFRASARLLELPDPGQARWKQATLEAERRALYRLFCRAAKPKRAEVQVG